MIYHLLTPANWPAQRDAPDYRAASLVTEGFIHCSTAEQVAASANRFFAGTGTLLVLHLDPAQLTAPLRYEPAGNGEEYPHLFGPLNRSAVVRVTELFPDAQGHYQFG